MNNKTFDKIQKAFGESYGFESDAYWRQSQEEFKELKNKVEKILEEA